MNKEQLRKELEDAIDGMWKNSGIKTPGEYKKYRDDYITTRIAALDDGDDTCPQCGSDNITTLNETTDQCFKCYYQFPRTHPKPIVDDEQEGKGLKFIEWEYKVRPSLVDWDLTDMGKQGWQLCAVNDKYYYFKRPLPEPHKP